MPKLEEISDHEIIDDEITVEEENLDIDSRLKRLLNSPEMFQLYQSERMESEHPCDKNIPKYRLVYENTGRVNVKFRSEKKLMVKLEDLRMIKMKFSDKKKTSFYVKDKKK